jgi:putative membrane protein
MRKLITRACGCVLGVALPMTLAVAVPTASARAHTASAAVSGLDKEYLKTSMEGDLFEIAGGKLARARTPNQAVRRLANRLISDHTKSYSDAAKLARRLGVDVSKSPSPSEQWELKIVSQLRGATFNHWYSSLEVYDHVQDIQEASDEVSDGSNSSVIDNARMDLPILRQHLHLARLALAASP